MTAALNLVEAAAPSRELSGGKWRAKLISADAWGSSGYYSSEVLKRDGARVFHEGLQMHQDHPSADEAWQRPERSVATLVGRLESNAVFEEDPEFGPGLYAEVSFYPSYVERMKEIGKDVGLSIHAEGLTENAERDGRFGPVVTGILSAKSVDVVTQAGAGGKLTSILESDRGIAGEPITSKENQSMTDVTKEDFDALVAKFNELPGLFVAALKDANIGAPATATTTEPTATATSTETPTATSTSTETATATATPTIDHAGIVEALRVNKLPGAAAGAVVTSILEGKSLEDAIKAQVELREAYVASTGNAAQGNMVLRESAAGTPGAELTGFERSLAKLGKPIATTKGMS